MNDIETTQLMARLANSVTVGPVPLRDLISDGRHARHRAHRIAAMTVAALVLGTGLPVLAFFEVQDRGSRPAVTAPLDGSWVTSIPADFPLVDGFPEPWHTVEKGLVPTCGSWSPPYTDKQVVAHSGVSAQRILLVFANDTAAHDALNQLKDVTHECSPVPTSQGKKSEVAPIDLESRYRSGDESYAFRRVTRDTGQAPATRSDLTVVEVSRTGNALFLDSAHRLDGDDGVLSSLIPSLFDRSQAPMRAMCAFSSAPCGSMGNPTAEP